ncbi:MAG: MFS transporter, partial [Cyanobacteria bacterium P01_F01_bin.42]
PCLIFATAQDFNQLVIGRLLLGIVGAGFVIGIRMTAEWFPPKEIGLAEGIYGGWGNFGSAFSALTLVLVAGGLSFFPGSVELATGGALNWRAAIALTGIIAAVYGFIYYAGVRDTPPGNVYQRPKSARGIEVTSVKDFWLLMLMNVPFMVILMVLAWRLQKVGFLNPTTMGLAWAFCIGLYLFQAYNAYVVNKDLLTGKKRYSPEDRYKFKQVAILELTYIVNFGSELAVVSMLPAFFEGTFGISKALAGFLGASYAFVNLIARPAGGLISDKLGSRRSTMGFLTLFMGIGYLVMSMIPNLGIEGAGAIFLAVIMTMSCSFFVQAGEGSTYSIVPLIKRRVTGQIAGSVGAYGNVGAVAYLTMYSLLPEWLGATGSEVAPAILSQRNVIFFQVLGVAALIVAFLCFFILEEPKGSFAEAHEGEDTSSQPVATGNL